ncbi:MAG: glycosyltransferase [Clostridia bacterium]|nr:glycosyltransferase [Clostridia bacterium]
MNILILTITTGHGHNQVAASVNQYAKDKGHNVDVLDALLHINPFCQKALDKGFLLSSSLTPAAYNTVYNLLDKRKPKIKKYMPYSLTYQEFDKKIVNYIKETKPDAIICTHVVAAHFVSNLKKVGINIPTFGIVTDYTIHPYWNRTDIDYYIIPNEELISEAVNKGIDKEKILPFGIPINPKFNTSTDKKEARKILGLEDKPTILMMSGSMGYGNLFKQLENLCESSYDFQIVTICGNNKRIKKKIDEHSFSKKIYNIGFSKNVHLYMDACDIAVTKPGGITVSEALVKCLPIILINPIPGHEIKNMDFLVKGQVAYAVSKDISICDIVDKLFKFDDEINCMKEKINLIRKPDASKDIIEFIEKFR